jgi:hypothetical protein
MLRITKGTADIPGTPIPGPMLLITVDVTGNHGPVDMQVEDVNGSTRDHNSPGAPLRIFHLMCVNASRPDELRILHEIAVAPESFYNQLYDTNKNQPNPPLILFRNDGGLAYNWTLIQTSLAGVQASVAAAGATVPTSTPCYAMLIAVNPITGGLLAIQITAVPHP